MSDFEEEFEIPASTEVDPAAEFLAKEQVGNLDNSKRIARILQWSLHHTLFAFPNLLSLKLECDGRPNGLSIGVFFVSLS